MIPKTIHYCWFGRNPKPKLAEKCIKSWKKKCPDYQVVEWNEDNFDISAAPLYVRQAYEAKKWAFVTDYVRLWALTNYGGIYMDTDVQVIKSLDSFLRNQAFSGFEDERNIPTGIMACEKGFPLFEEFLAYYNDAVFHLPDGSYNTQTNVATITRMCSEKGLIQNNSLQNIEGFIIYPKDVFCPVSYITHELKKTKSTVTIHWFSGSWLSDEQKERARKRKKEYFKMKRVNFIDYFIHTPNRVVKKLVGQDHYERLKKRLKG